LTPPAETEAAKLVANADVEHVRLAGAEAHDPVTDDPTRQVQGPAGVTDAQAVAEDVLAPRERIAGLLDGGDLGEIDLHHRPDVHLRHFTQVFAPRGHQAFPPPASFA
jgi:hypothetical protein